MALLVCDTEDGLGALPTNASCSALQDPLPLAARVGRTGLAGSSSVRLASLPLGRSAFGSGLCCLHCPKPLVMVYLSRFTLSSVRRICYVGRSHDRCRTH